MSNSAPRERLLRLSLREMLGLMAMIALAIASLKFANEAFLALVAGVTMLALVAALIIAAVDRGPRQAFAIGAALTMIAYGLILTTGQRTSGISGNVISRNVEFDQWEGRLPTTRLLRYVHAAVERGEWIATMPMLQKGATGDLAEVLQRVLNTRITPSPNISVDGDFGLNTEAAVKQFQAQAGLMPTGIVDNNTWQALGPLIDAVTGKILPAYDPKLSITLSTGGGGFAPNGYASYREIPPREIFMPIGHCWWALVLGYAGGQFGRFVYDRRAK